MFSNFLAQHQPYMADFGQATAEPYVGAAAKTYYSNGTSAWYSH